MPYDDSLRSLPPLALRGKELLANFGPAKQWPSGAGTYDPDTNPHGMIRSLSVAENTLLSEELVEYINKKFHLTVQHLKYRPSLFNSGLPNMTLSAAKFLNDSLNPAQKISPRQILVGPGVGCLLSHILWSICSPGDGVLLTCPFYADYPKNVAWPSGARVVPVVAPPQVDSLSLEIVPYMRETLLEKENRISAIILCNPHNPIGRTYSADMILEYAKLAEEFGVHLIADEVFANEVFASRYSPNPTPFKSILSFSPEKLPCHPGRIHVVAGPTKDLGASGIKLGMLVSQHNPDVVQAVGTVIPVTPLSTASDAIFSGIIEDEAFLRGFLEKNRIALGRAFELLAHWCEQQGFPFIVSEAAVFALVDFENLAQTIPGNTSISEKMDEVIEKLGKHGVLLRSSTDSQDPVSTRLRIVFSTPAPIMKVALRRIETVFGLPHVDLDERDSR